MAKTSLKFSLLACLLAFGSEINADRIVGGEEVAIEEFPWQVSILDANGHFCGGVIIDKRRILTAAHCIQRNNNPDYEEFIRVRAGSTNRLRGGVLRGVAKAITHKNFGDPVEFNNDIAILFLKHPLVYSASIQPIALPAANEQILANSTVFVSGWGFRRLQDEVFLPTVLNAVAVPIVEHTDCENAYGDDLTANMICAGIWKVGGKDSCQGDSGGPLIKRTVNESMLYGIVSFGQDCALPDYPGVYTATSRYTDWIRKAR